MRSSASGQPYHVEKGFDPSSSTVSLFPALPPIPVFNYADNSPKAILDTISHAIAANINCHGELVLIISGEHLFNIEPAGMTKAEIKEYIAERVNEMSPGLVFDAERAYELGGVTPFEDPVSEERTVPTLPEQLHLYVAGGTGGAVSAIGAYILSWTFEYVGYRADHRAVDPFRKTTNNEPSSRRSTDGRQAVHIIHRFPLFF